ncbi:MAG: sensor histidine kinase [Ferruginibacter sp.]|nr:sensor histidine kinase [Ferruginibacter sp.]
MKKTITFLAVLQFFFVITNAQQKNTIDSLQKAVKQNIADTQKVKIYYKLSKLYADAEDSTNAVNNYFSGIKIAKEKKLHAWEVYGYNEIGFLYELMNENKIAINYYKQAINNAKQYNLLPELGKAYRNTAFAMANLGKVETAIKYDDSTIFTYSKAGILVEKANAINNQGLRYHSLNKNNLALENYYKALTIYDNLKEEKKKANTVLNIGQIHLQQKNYDIALNFFFKAKDLAIKTNYAQPLLLSENNIGVVYFEQKKYADAIPYFERSMEIAKSVKNKNSELQAITNLGTCYQNIGNYTKADEYYKKAEQKLLTTSDYEGILTNYVNQASLAGMQKNYNQCLAYTDKCFYYLNNYDGLTKYKHYVYENAAFANKMLGNFDKAFMLQDSQIIYKDISINEKANSELLELQTKYETEKKQLTINLLSKSDSIKSLRIENQTAEINKQQLSIAGQQLAISQSNLKIVNDSLLLAENNLQLIENDLQLANKNKIISINKLKEIQQQQHITNLAQEKKIRDLEISKKNNLLLGLSLLIPLLILGSFFWYKHKQQQQQHNLQTLLFEQQKKATINILAAEEKERKRIASDLHDGVGQLMTAAWLNMKAVNEKAKNKDKETADLLDKAMHLVDESCKEVRAVSHNMMPNALLKKGLINAIREFLQQINVKSTKINLQTEGLNKSLPNDVETVLYRVIQESVNNVIKHAQASSLDISINQDEAGIDIMIEDNGKGFNINEVNKKDGIGLQNIKSRIEYLKGTVEWNTAENKGTLVAIHIPESK